VYFFVLLAGWDSLLELLCGGHGHITKELGLDRNLALLSFTLEAQSLCGNVRSLDDVVVDAHI
jgi:hypothetical protein